MKLLYVNSSHGSLAVNADTGDVLPDQSTYDGDALRPIKKFDLPEWRGHWKRDLPESLDILDVGYWNADGSYEEPAHDWREDTRAHRDLDAIL